MMTKKTTSPEDVSMKGLNFWNIMFINLHVIIIIIITVILLAVKSTENQQQQTSKQEMA